MRETVTNNATQQRHELSIAGEVAFAAYRKRGNVVAFIHTEVPPALEVRGIGPRLIERALADVREPGLRVRGECSFVAAFIDRHPAERDLVA